MDQVKELKEVKGKMSVAEFLTKQIDLVTSSGEKNQKKIAEECGYNKPNMITMFKQGLTNLPLYKVELMAKSIHVDPVYLLRLVMQQDMPDAYETIERIVGAGSLLSESEKEIIEMIREVCNGDVKMNTPMQKQAFEYFLKTISK